MDDEGRGEPAAGLTGGSEKSCRRTEAPKRVEGSRRDELSSNEMPEIYEDQA